MQVKLLATLLQKAPPSLLSIPPGAEREIATLIEAVERNGERSLSELVRVIDKAWPKPKTPTAKKPTPGAPFDPSGWVARLYQARDDGATFQELLQELAKSKQLKAAEVAAIANGFRSTTKSYKSKSAAVEDLRKAWMEGRRDADKARKVDGIF
jgi:hypothetical protein